MSEQKPIFGICYSEEIDITGKPYLEKGERVV